LSDGKKLYSFVDVDDSTPIQKLKITDQLRVLLKSFTYDPANDLKNEDIVTQEYLTLRANLYDFLHKATEPIRRGKSKSVIVNISTKFNPVFNDVIQSHEIADLYKVDVVRPKIDYDLPYDIMVRLTVKED
jgi:hypothetical protein